METAGKTLILATHPKLSESRANSILAEGIRGVPGVEVRDLYALYPDYKIDVAAEQRELETCSTLVFQFPLYWYSTPALLKLWQDEVLTWGFAFGSKGRALEGKAFFCAVTTGGAADLYQAGGRHGSPVETFLLPIRQTVETCGMIYHPAFILHGLSKLPTEEVEAGIAEYHRRLIEVACRSPL